MTVTDVARVPRRGLRPRLRLPAEWRSPLTIVGAVIVLAWVLIAVFAPVLQPSDPLLPVGARLQPPSAAHWFGTDTIGRDVLSRVIAGSRISLPVALVIVAASVVLGSVLGAVAGYFGHVVDEVIMRFTDLVLAFPTIILAMVISAALGPSLANAVIAMLLVSWPQYARVMRSLVIGTKDADFVVAGRLLGVGPLTSLRRDILPTVVSPILVMATLDLGGAILLLSGLSFLGLGVVAPTAEWGSMVSEGMNNFSAWWISTFPGLAVFTVVVAFNFIGDALRDALDPRGRTRLGVRAL